MACVHRRPFKDGGWGRHETTGPVVRKLSAYVQDFADKEKEETDPGRTAVREGKSGWSSP